MKRFFDVLLAVLALPFAAAVVLGLGIGIRLTSPGPAIFRQVRVGQFGKTFVCLKLRTMYVETPNAPSHNVGAASITPLGAILRRTKADELPQLWNIVVGEMSFVGPRPCLPSQTELIAARRSRGLEAIPPGITGISQVRGVDMSDPAALAAMDATYLSDMSLLTDMKIIGMTIIGRGQGDRVGL